MPNRYLVVADVSNLYFTINLRFNGPRLDYRKFLEAATIGAGTFKAIAYGSELEDGATDRFKSVLQSIGFETRYRKIKIYKGPDGKETYKNDWDVGITVDVISMMDQFDVFVLGSADGDMSPLIRYLQDNGKVCNVIGCRLSRELKETANDWSEVGASLLENQNVPA